MSFQQVMALNALPEGQPVKQQLGKTAFILLRDGDHVSAFQDKCPHAGAPMDEGAVCEGKLICPWHKAMFNSRSGKLLEPLALSDLQRYPVQLEAGQIAVDTAAITQSDQLTAPGEQPVWVILGAGAAGSAAAWTLRNEGFDGKLILIDKEQQAPYDRTALTKFVPAGKMTLDEVPSPLAPDFSRFVERRFAQVVRLDARQKTLWFSDQQSLKFDRLLIASGGCPLRPDIPGIGLSGVHVLRSIDQAAALLREVEKTQHLVIIGNSFIGMELASALRNQGIRVQIIARDALPFKKVFGETIAGYFYDLHKQNGVGFVTGEVVALDGDDQQLRAVRLANGKTIEAKTLLIATGVVPACGFVHDLPQQYDGSLLADHFLQVAPDIWAVGDCVSWADSQGTKHIEHWRVAQQQGRIAALNMLGHQQVFDRVPFFWTTQFGTRYEYLGHGGDWDEYQLFGCLQDKDFIALYGRQGRLRALASCGRYRLTAEMIQRMQRPMTMAEAKAQVLSC
ncbi:pyridine nucleotide-disulfide oxidoreductase [Erwinia sp. OLTSP20]|uniref:FAD-dependent oxidoreductase n=1 Tax=unclassified Erwinia TaxID=2622719 RepID=UPI000C18A480|nr:MULTISPECIES: FAD-dependent oxidoreductase [unclassified Erwinia]PIJ49029.1 pyridine nucleotide-disulfide oxidoreductase [Erwinia sp. OAMSP11]PIJ75023.1 pyridine nucleotide-disulfide oxidoreductase [Erwinia sp. OLSSP12]PIJ79714.1 pyridine nucleotide-disulfide oxidoreductase [Erwinia sp. OLCASP19]PIJ80499.1 pyridine nucleotide-disulfide oxidoreductase [Erwinia sp. OLMTSP26]PIJ82614.1 pyridine nucleotide-disulfide oxidoreductase [Erwinia sp. OLMDSP33]